jgi:excisionase family DNA binding protein
VTIDPGLIQGPTLDSIEAAALMRISSEKVRMMLRAGELRGIKIGSHWRIRRQDVEALLAGEA